MSETPSDDGIELVPLATVSVAGGDRYKVDNGPFGRPRDRRHPGGPLGR